VADLGVTPFRALYGTDVRLAIDAELFERDPNANPPPIIEHFGAELNILRDILHNNLVDAKKTMEEKHKTRHAAHIRSWSARVSAQRLYQDWTK